MRLKIGAKLLLSFAAILAVTATVGFVAITQITTIDDADTHMYEKSVVALQSLTFVNQAVNYAQWRLRDLMLTTDQALNAKYKEEIAKLRKDAAAEVEKIGATLDTPEGKRIFLLYKNETAAYGPIFDKMIELAVANRNDEALALLYGEGAPIFDRRLKALDEMTAFKSKEANIVAESNTRIAAAARTLVIALLGVGLLLSAAIGLLMARSLSRPIGEATAIAGRIARGDLGAEVPETYLRRGDEIGAMAKAFEEMLGNLAEIARGIQSAASNVASGSEQISSTAQQMSQGATEQAASAEEGLAQLALSTFQVALLDHELPGMHGLVLGEYLRRNNPDIAVALVTGSDEPRLDKRSRALGITHIRKPFQPKDIWRARRDHAEAARERAVPVRRREDEDWGPPIARFADDLTGVFEVPGLSTRVGDTLVAAIKRKHSDMEVSVSAYPEKHPESASLDADIDALKAKVDAGATRAITQFFFDNDLYFRYIDRVRAAGITIPIVPGILPVQNFKLAKNFAARAGASVPDWLAAKFEGLDDDAAPGAQRPLRGRRQGRGGP